MRFIRTLKVNVKKCLADEDGATAIEYGLIAGGVALGIVTATFALGDGLSIIFDAIVEAMLQVEDDVSTS